MDEHNESANADIPPSVAMLRMILGFRVSRSIYVAAKLGIADLLKDGPKSSEELARLTSTHPASLYRVIRALASVGIFAEDELGRFSLTPIATTLQSDVPGSLRLGDFGLRGGRLPRVGRLDAHRSDGSDELRSCLRYGYLPI